MVTTAKPVAMLICLYCGWYDFGVVGLADSSMWEWDRAVTSMGDTCNGTGVGIVTRGGTVGCSVTGTVSGNGIGRVLLGLDRLNGVTGGDTIVSGT